MNILTLNYEYPPIGGGGGVATKQIAEGFVEAGHNVDLVTSRGPGLKKRETVEGVDVYRVKVNRKNQSTASVSSMLAYPLSGLKTAVRLCQRRDYDCIHSHFAIPTGPLGMMVSKWFDLPHVLSIHGGDIYDPTKQLSPHNNWLLRGTVSRVLQSADAVVAQSTDTKMRARQYYGIENDAIDVVPLPYEPTPFDAVPADELGLDAETTYLISVGRLVERKGYEYLLRAMTELDDVELLLAGDGPLKDSLQSLAESLGIEDRVHFLGYVSEQEKFQHLDVASVYVLSSLHEGFGIVVQEALQTGLPIIATNEGGQTDIVEDSVHGRLIEPRNPAAIVDAVCDVLEDGPSTYTERNQRRIERYQLGRICDEYIKTFKDSNIYNR